MMSLTTRQRQYLKGLGHELKSVIQVGKEGLSDRVLASAATALKDHELIKVGLLETAGLDRKAAGRTLAERLDAELVQVVGFKILLYRRREKNPTIKLPPSGKSTDRPPRMLS